MSDLIATLFLVGTGGTLAALILLHVAVAIAGFMLGRRVVQFLWP